MSKKNKKSKNRVQCFRCECMDCSLERQALFKILKDIKDQLAQLRDGVSQANSVTNYLRRY